VWTLCSHAVVLAGGSLRALVALFGAAGLAAVAWRAWQRTRAANAESAPMQEPPAAPDSAPAQHARSALAAVAAVAALALDPVAHPILFWFALVGVLGAAACWFLLREAPAAEAPRAGRREEAGLVALGLLCALYALFVHRPDADDAFYVNVAVAAVDHPELPLLARDTLHGRFDLPVHLPSYLLHSYELALGALSLLTGAPAIYLFHLVAAPLAAFCVPLAHAALFRVLTPRCWLWTTVLLVLVLALPGETHRWYGNFAFVRMWQGKAVLLSILLPLLALLAIRFGLAPSRAGWLRLAAAQVAAVGASASALWLAPAVALASLASVLRATPRDLRRLGLGALASAYPIAAALAIQSGMRAHATPQLAERFAPGEQLARALTTALGDATLLRVGCAALLLAWACWGRGLARRYAIALPLAVALVLLVPWADGFVRAQLTGPSYWRALWAVPVPILIALALASPLQWPGAAGRAASAALMLAFALAVPRSYGFGAGNHAQLRAPGLRIPDAAGTWARRIDALAPGARVVAPPRIATWIPVFHQHAYPLAVRSYLEPIRERVGETSYQERRRMMQMADGGLTDGRSLALFARGLALYDVGAVCLAAGPGAPALRGVLRESGFSRRVQANRLEIWLREDVSRAGQPSAVRPPAS
jgi:hypothetical protein